MISICSNTSEFVTKSVFTRQRECVASAYFYFIFFITQLLLMCGDIELNPGPMETNAESVSSDESNTSLLHTLTCGMKIVHLNVRSLLPKLDSISIELNEFDIIALSETFLDSSILNGDLHIEGFQMPFRNDRNRHGGGVAVYVKNNIHASRLPFLENDSLETIWLKIKNRNDILLFNCSYRPPNSDNAFWEKIYDGLSAAREYSPSPLILVGDLNSNYLDNNSDIRQLCTFSSLDQIIAEPTRIPSNTLIDHILTNARELCLHSGVLDPFCSDHKPVFVCINHCKHRLPAIKRLVWNYNLGDYNKFREILAGIDWHSIFQSHTNLDEIVDTFTSKILEIAKTCIPNKFCIIRPRDKPWMNGAIRREIRKRRRIHKRAKLTDNAIDWQHFRIQRNKVCSMVRSAKDDYFTKTCDSLRNIKEISSKKWWNICKYLYTRKSGNSSIPTITDNGNDICSAFEESELFNSFFASISI